MFELGISYRPEKEEMGCLKMALEVKHWQLVLNSVTCLHRIGSRGFTDERGKKPFFPFTKYVDNCHQNGLLVTWYHPPWRLETLPLTSVDRAVVFYRFFKGGSSFHIVLMLLLLNVFTLALGLVVKHCRYLM